ncbi:unnamed protein product, partial [Ceratitis capitata]
RFNEFTRLASHVPSETQCGKQRQHQHVGILYERTTNQSGCTEFKKLERQCLQKCWIRIH